MNQQNKDNQILRKKNRNLVMKPILFVNFFENTGFKVTFQISKKIF